MGAGENWYWHHERTYQDFGCSCLQAYNYYSDPLNLNPIPQTLHPKPYTLTPDALYLKPYVHISNIYTCTCMCVYVCIHIYAYIFITAGGDPKMP